MHPVYCSEALACSSALPCSEVPLATGLPADLLDAAVLVVMVGGGVGP